MEPAGDVAARDQSGLPDAVAAVCAAAQTGVVGQAYVAAQLEWLLGLVSQQQERTVQYIG